MSMSYIRWIKYVFMVNLSLFGAYIWKEKDEQYNPIMENIVHYSEGWSKIKQLLVRVIGRQTVSTLVSAITAHLPTISGRGCIECWNSNTPLREKAAMRIWEHYNWLILISSGLRLWKSVYLRLNAILWHMIKKNTHTCIATKGMCHAVIHLTIFPSQVHNDWHQQETLHNYSV